MIIDFHTHTYPDKIAEKVVEKLYAMGGTPVYREPTYDGLVKSARESGIDYSVSLPVATSPNQVESINRLSVELNGRNGIIFAGAIHPDTDNVAGVLDYLRDNGIRVIKVHPDYQETNFDDERYIKILYEAASRNIITVTHAGVDAAYRSGVHCTPDMIIRVLDRLSGIIDNKLVLAHMGSNELPGEVLEKLCGRPVYMDTAYCIWKQPGDIFEKIIKKHGADKILFASDSPWAPQKDFIGIINSYNLTDDEKKKIFCDNAAGLLGLPV